MNDENFESNKNYVFVFKKKETVIPEPVRQEWVPSNEYQDVPPGYYAMPAGLEYIINLETGRRQARLPQKQKNNFGGSDSKSSNTQKTILNEDDYIPVSILDEAAEIIRIKAKNNGIDGFVAPSKLLQHVKENKPLPSENIELNSANAINIHYLENKHYVVSYKTSFNSKIYITVYDSLPVGKQTWQKRLKDLPPQLKFLYGDTSEVKVI
jgi:hypothetical protein